jgi:ubiquitin-protein ligase
MNLDDPLMAETAKAWKDDPVAAENKARSWVQLYAGKDQ